MRPAWTVTFSLSLWACAQRAATRPADHSVTAASPASDAAAVTVDAAAPAVDAAVTSAEAVAPSPAVRPVDTQPDLDPKEWFASRGVKASLDEFPGYHCVELVVGKAREEALLCDETREGGGEPPPGPWVETHRVVRVARAGKIVSVLDVTSMVQGFDSGYPRLKLQLNIAPDGMSATLEDRGVVQGRFGGNEEVDSSQGCKAATRDAEFLFRLCKGRGSFQWKAGRFERTR